MEIVSVILTLLGIPFLFKGIDLMAQRDYVTGLVAVLAGYAIMKTGTEFSRMALLSARKKSNMEGE